MSGYVVSPAPFRNEGFVRFEEPEGEAGLLWVAVWMLLRKEIKDSGVSGVRSSSSGMSHAPARRNGWKLSFATQGAPFPAAISNSESDGRAGACAEVR